MGFQQSVVLGSCAFLLGMVFVSQVVSCRFEKRESDPVCTLSSAYLTGYTFNNILDTNTGYPTMRQRQMADTLDSAG